MKETKMSKLTFKTFNSTYVLDEENETWERTETNGVVDPDNPLRSISGEMWGHSAIVIGWPVLIYGPPMVPDSQMRAISTTEVVEGDTAGEWYWNFDSEYK